MPRAFTLESLVVSRLSGQCTWTARCGELHVTEDGLEFRWRKGSVPMREDWPHLPWNWDGCPTKVESKGTDRWEWTDVGLVRR